MKHRLDPVTSYHKPLMVAHCRRKNTSRLSGHAFVHSTASPWASFHTPYLQVVIPGIADVLSVRQAQKCSLDLGISVLPPPYFRSFLYSYHSLSCPKVICGCISASSVRLKPKGQNRCSSHPPTPVSSWVVYLCGP